MKTIVCWDQQTTQPNATVYSNIRAAEPTRLCSKINLQPGKSGPSVLFFWCFFFLRPPNFLSLLHVVQGKRWRFSRNSTKSYGCLGTWRRTTFSNHQWMQASKSSYAEARRGCFEQKRFLLHCCRLQCLIRLIYSTVCTHDWQSFFCRNDFILSKPSNRADSFWLKKPNTYLHYEAALTHCTILCIYTSRLIRGNL